MADFDLRKGAFYTFCKAAEEDDGRDWFFIIDEINRGNLSKILGELFMLIEAAKGRTLIIDAKYYAHNTQLRFDRRTVHSGNLYQMFAYVKNEEERLARLGEPHEVSGLVLYAKTDEEEQPGGTWSMSGNSIGVGTVDLGADFAAVAETLDGIVERYFSGFDDVERLAAYLPRVGRIDGGALGVPEDSDVAREGRRAEARRLRDEVMRFVDAHGELTTYDEVLGRYGVGLDLRQMKGYDVSEAPLELVLALLVGLTRAEHWLCSDVFADASDDGTLTRWLERLQETVYGSREE